MTRYDIFETIVLLLCAITFTIMAYHGDKYAFPFMVIGMIALIIKIAEITEMK